MTAIPEICVTLRKGGQVKQNVPQVGIRYLWILLAQVEQGPVQSHHPHFLTGHCHAGGKLFGQFLAEKLSS